MNKNLAIIISVIGLLWPLSDVSAGIVLSSHKYAWSDNVGYINFENVTVDDSVLDGYGWSANKGFINVSPDQGGVLNDGAGNLSGSAWGEQLGYIDFNNVSIDGNGVFSGTATGDIVGTITFDCPTYCDVETDWRPVSPTPTPAPTIVPGSSSNSAAGVSINPIPTREPVPSLPDTGLDEESGQAKLIDIEKDGIINIIDFNALMVDWGKTVDLAAVGSVGNPADINKDGAVDIFDLNTLMVYWGSTY